MRMGFVGREDFCVMTFSDYLPVRVVLYCGVIVLGGSQEACSALPPVSGYETAIKIYKPGGDKLECSVSISEGGLMIVTWYGTSVKGTITTHHLTERELVYLWAPLKGVDVFLFQSGYGVMGIRDAASDTVYLKPANSVESDFTFHLGTRVKTIRALMGAPQPLLEFERRMEALSGIRGMMAQEPASV